MHCRLENSVNPEARALLNFCHSYNLPQLIDTPTRVTDTSKSILDVILASDTNLVQKKRAMECSISDHDLVYVVLRLKNIRRRPVYITVRSFKHYHPNAFCKDISQAPWSIVDVFDHAEEKLYVFNSLFIDILEDHAPVKTFKLRGNKPNLCITDDIRTIMKTRDYWGKEARKTGDPIVWRTYRELRQVVKGEIKNAENEFFADEILKHPNNTNNIWKTIRQFIPTSTKRAFNCKGDRSIAEDFNRFFVSVGRSTVNKSNL